MTTRSRSPLLASNASSVTVALLRDESEKERIGVADLQAMLSIRGVGSHRIRQMDAIVLREYQSIESKA